MDQGPNIQLVKNLIQAEDGGVLITKRENVHKSPHEMSIRGTMKWVEHFCALCLQKSRTIRYHAECDSDCPNSQGRTQWGIQGGQPQTNNCPMCCNAWLFITKLIISIITCLCYSWGRSN